VQKGRTESFMWLTTQRLLDRKLVNAIVEMNDFSNAGCHNNKTRDYEAEASLDQTANIRFNTLLVFDNMRHCSIDIPIYS